MFKPCHGQKQHNKKRNPNACTQKTRSQIIQKSQIPHKKFPYTGKQLAFRNYLRNGKNTRTGKKHRHFNKAISFLNCIFDFANLRFICPTSVFVPA